MKPAPAASPDPGSGRAHDQARDNGQRVVREPAVDQDVLALAVRGEEPVAQRALLEEPGGPRDVAGVAVARHVLQVQAVQVEAALAQGPVGDRGHGAAGESATAVGLAHPVRHGARAVGLVDVDGDQADERVVVPRDHPAPMLRATGEQIDISTRRFEIPHLALTVHARRGLEDAQHRRGVVGPQRAQVVGFGCCFACHEGDSIIPRPARARRRGWARRAGPLSRAVAVRRRARRLPQQHGLLPPLTAHTYWRTFKES